MDRYDAQSFVDEFRGGMGLYRRLLDEHVYPPFTNPERSAMEEANRVFADYMKGPYIEEKQIDAAVYAERADARRLAKYDELFAMQTILMNLFGAGLFHLFEQQMAYMVRHDGHAVGSDVLASFSTWANDVMGISVADFREWSSIQELKLVANVAKHAEGRSETELRKLRVDLFGHPLLREPAFVTFLQPKCRHARPWRGLSLIRFGGRFNYAA